MILQSSSWLNDNLIFAAHCLLKDQSKGTIHGFKSTQCSRRIGEDKFPPVPQNSSFIQLLHVANCHWITASNIDIRGKTYYNDAVCVYDSGIAHVSFSTKETICQFMKPRCDALLFDVMNIQPQPNLNDCGLFALACATELVHGFDPVLCYFDCAAMRLHLLTCLETGHLNRFPCIKQRRVPLGSRIRKSSKEPIYCICRMPNDKIKPIISCDQCMKWFHKECETLSTDVSHTGMKWICSGCKGFIQSLVD